MSLKYNELHLKLEILITAKQCMLCCYIFGLASALASCTHGHVNIPACRYKLGPHNVYTFSFTIRLRFIVSFVSACIA